MMQEMLLAHKYRATLSDLLDELKTDPEAMTLFEEFYPEVWDDLAEQGYRCLELEQLPQAVRIFSFLLEHQPENPAYAAGYADAQYGMKQYTEAAEGYITTTEQAPHVPDAHFLLGEIWMFFQHPENAIECLEKVQDILQEDTEHYLFNKSCQYMQKARQDTL